MSSYDQLRTSPANRLWHRSKLLDNYELTQAFVTAHRASVLDPEPHLAGGLLLYPYDMNDYESRSDISGCRLYGRANDTGSAHRWDSGWVPAAMAALYQDSLSLPPGPRTLETTSPATAGQDAADGVRVTVRLRFSPPVRGGAEPLEPAGERWR